MSEAAQARLALVAEAACGFEGRAGRLMWRKKAHHKRAARRADEGIGWLTEKSHLEMMDLQIELYSLRVIVHYREFIGLKRYG